MMIMADDYDDDGVDAGSDADIDMAIGYGYGYDGDGDMIWKKDDELSGLFGVIGAKEQCSQCQYQSTLSPISYILNMARLCTKS